MMAAVWCGRKTWDVGSDPLGFKSWISSKLANPFVPHFPLQLNGVYNNHFPRWL